MSDLYMTTVETRTVQAGVNAWGAGRITAGPVDGRWGPRTRSGYRLLVNAIAPALSLDPDEAFAATRAADGATQVAVPAPIADELYRLAEVWARDQRRRGETTTPAPTTPQPPSLVVQRASVWPAVAGFVGAAVLVGGLGYLAWKYA